MMGTTHATHISWDCIQRKKKRIQAPSISPLYHVQDIAIILMVQDGRQNTNLYIQARMEGTWKKSMTFKEQSWKLTPYIFTYISLISTESPGHIWLQRKLGNTVFILDGHKPNQCLMDLLTRQKGRMNIRMDKQSENFLKEVIFELNEKKELGMQILAEQALQEK